MVRVGLRQFSTLVALFGLLGACGGNALPPATPRAEVTLPAARRQGPLSLEQALAERRSVRSFSPRPLSWEEISQLLWAAQGESDPRGFRTAPSAGALYPLELYVVLAEGYYHYLPAGHRLELLGTADLRPALWAAGLHQPPLRQPPAIFVFTAVVARSAGKYGSRAERYATLEAGHAAQNLLLQATALRLGAVPIGAFEDQQVREALGLPSSYTPLYLIPVGEPTPPEPADSGAGPAPPGPVKTREPGVPAPL